MLDLVKRIEGGEVLSFTARRIMKKFHNVEVGAYSYGPCFDPEIAQGGIRIGRYTSIAKGVRFFTENHPTETFSTHPMFYTESENFVKGSLRIGHDVWIGSNAIITPGCNSIGNGAIVGAGSVVTRDVAPYAIVAGNPARTIRHRSSTMEEARLSERDWWDLSADEVCRTLDKSLVNQGA